MPDTSPAADRVTLGMVGLGRMGANLVRRAMADGHHCVVCDRQAPRRGGRWWPRAPAASTDLAALVAGAARAARRLGHGPGRATSPSRVVAELIGLLEPGDCIIDGGNSYYRDDIRRGEAAAAKGIDYLDVGTSGGVWGLERGYCLMIGGPDRAVERLAPLWDTIAPGVDARADAPRAATAIPPPRSAAGCTAARAAPATSSRWSTTASSTG